MHKLFQHPTAIFPGLPFLFGGKSERRMKASFFLKVILISFVSLFIIIVYPQSVLYAKGSSRSSYKSSGSLKGLGGYKSSGRKSSGGYKSPKVSYKSTSPKIRAPKLNLSGSSTGTKIKSYYRKDGTPVRSHYRSNPDSDKSNNFGQPSSEQRKEYKTSPTLPSYKYNYDKDGLKNAHDKDDDNDFVPDNVDKAPYNPNRY